MTRGTCRFAGGFCPCPAVSSGQGVHSFDTPCRTGHRVAGSGGRLQRPAGVEYYHVDYVGLRKRFYSAEGGMTATAINYEGLPPVVPEFDAAALRANILDSQRHGQPYREFNRRGPCRTGHRSRFLRGKRVTYWGRTGDQHTEWFPGAGPIKKD